MNKVLEEKFTAEKPDDTFEQRMLAGFRNRIPQRTGGLAKLIVDLMRLRVTQITAVAAVLLALVQVGRMITGEGATAPRSRESSGEEQFATAKLAQAAPRSANQVAELNKSASGETATDRLAPGKPFASLTANAPPV